MTHPVLYAGSAVLGGGVLLAEGALVVGLMQSDTPDVTAAQITAYGVIVLGIIAGIPIILNAWGAAKTAAAKAEEAAATAKLALAAAMTAAALAQKNLDKTEEIAADTKATLADGKVTLGHVNSAATEARALVAAQELQLAAQQLIITKLENVAALAAQAAAIRMAQVPLATEPVSATPAAAAMPATIAEAAKVIADASPQLDSIEQTGEATHVIVRKIEEGK